jgi:hypothetical protein
LGEEERREEAKVLEEFRSMKGKILGAILEGISGGLRWIEQVRSEVQGKVLPRMADWAVWGEAIARGLGMEPFRFMNSYLRLCKEATITVLEEDPVGKAMLRLAERLEELPESEGEPTKDNLPFERKGIWVGRVVDLPAKLKEVMPEEADNLPRRPQDLGKRLKNLIPNLAERGVKVETYWVDSTRVLRISVLPVKGNLYQEGVCYLLSFPAQTAQKFLVLPPPQHTLHLSSSSPIIGNSPRGLLRFMSNREVRDEGERTRTAESCALGLRGKPKTVTHQR